MRYISVYCYKFIIGSTWISFDFGKMFLYKKRAKGWYPEAFSILERSCTELPYLILEVSHRII